MKTFRQVWVMDPLTGKFLRDEYNVPEDSKDFKFTTDPLESGMYSPHYQGTPPQSRGLVTGGEWVDLNPRDEVPEIDFLRSSMGAHIDQRRDRILRSGAPVTLSDGTGEVVQTRSEGDLINITGMVQKAILLHGTDATLRFRFMSNVTRELTPTEMISVGTQVAEHREGVYGESWLLKDSINSASTLEEIEAIMGPYLDD